MISGLKRALSVLVTLSFTGVRCLDTECGQNELNKCARPFQVLSDTSDLHFASTKEELVKICPDLKNGLECISTYTHRCLDVKQRSHFRRLYQGTGAAVRDLCQEGPYQERFLKHASCLKDLKPQYEHCASQYQRTIALVAHNTNASTSVMQAENNMRTVCCSFQEYMACSVRAVMAKCGQDSADFTHDFLHRMGDTLMQMHCREYVADSHLCAQSKSEQLNGSAKYSYSALLAILMPIMATIINYTTN